jgi:hypothetical protein
VLENADCWFDIINQQHINHQYWNLIHRWFHLPIFVAMPIDWRIPKVTIYETLAKSWDCNGINMDFIINWCRFSSILPGLPGLPSFWSPFSGTESLSLDTGLPKRKKCLSSCEISGGAPQWWWVNVIFYPSLDINGWFVCLKKTSACRKMVGFHSKYRGFQFGIALQAFFWDTHGCCWRGWHSPRVHDSSICCLIWRIPRFTA